MAYPLYAGSTPFAVDGTLFDYSETEQRGFLKGLLECVRGDRRRSYRLVIGNHRSIFSGWE